MDDKTKKDVAKVAGEALNGMAKKTTNPWLKWTFGILASLALGYATGYLLTSCSDGVAIRVITDKGAVECIMTPKPVAPTKSAK